MLNSRWSYTLPSDTERNLKEHVKTITLRSGKELSNPTIEKKNNKKKEDSERGIDGRSVET